MKRTSSTLIALALLGMALRSPRGLQEEAADSDRRRPSPGDRHQAHRERGRAPSAAAPSKDEVAEVLAMDIDVLNKKGYLSDAFFDYDQADLREDARSVLAGDAQWLKKHATVQVLIEGHCDERGTAAYNLALGDRRANAAKEYLISLGIDGSRLRTVSYGKERPFCTESTESCWQKNRRAHLVITAK